MEAFIGIFRGFFNAVHRINEEYKEPEIKMDRTVAIALLMLRLYLLFMVAILLFKFISLAFSGALGVMP